MIDCQLVNSFQAYKNEGGTFFPSVQNPETSGKQQDES